MPRLPILRSGGDNAAKSVPRKFQVKPGQGSNPKRTLRIEVFPEPEGPIRAVTPLSKISH